MIRHFVFTYHLRTVISVFISTLVLYVGALSAARYLHNDLLHKVVRAPIPTFFDVTPLGRIINRFSHDVDAVDNDLPATLRAWCSCFFGVFFFIRNNNWNRSLSALRFSVLNLLRRLFYLFILMSHSSGEELVLQDIYCFGMMVCRSSVNWSIYENTFSSVLLLSTKHLRFQVSTFFFEYTISSAWRIQ